MHDSVKAHARTPFREEAWRQLSEGVRFVQGEFGDDEAFDRLRDTVEELDASRGTGGNHAFYLSVPPQRVPRRLQAAGTLGAVAAPRTAPGAPVVIEKPMPRCYRQNQTPRQPLPEAAPSTA